MKRNLLFSATSLKTGWLRSDLLVGCLVMAIVALMIIPVPIALLDSLLAVNLCLSVLLLMAALFAHHTLDLSTFPSMLLFTTLLRLGLNIASTKSILLHADAGHLITSFGELVVAGNLVVGLIVFSIITVVQFVVITKGSERVAEVGARFTLDAMPGRQMAIDADLRAGHLSAAEAQRLREQLTVESQLHGGMDGAMKFVKGDAIAGVVITLINLLGGIAVGVMYHAMTASQAASHFAVLSIGDAMVSSLPSLFISVAAGVLITRVDSMRNGIADTLGSTIVRQLTSTSSALGMAALAMLAMAAIPGFPHIQFLGLAIGLAWLARKANAVPYGSGTASDSQNSVVNSRGPDGSLARAPGAITSPLGLRVSATFGSSMDMRKLQTTLAEQRQRLQIELGLVFPSLEIWMDQHWSLHAFEIQIQEVPVLNVQFPRDRVWTTDKDHPLWASAPQSSELPILPDLRWLPVADAIGHPSEKSPEQLVALLCHNALHQHAARFMGIQEVMALMESVSPEYSGLVSEVQKILPIQRQAEVLVRLLEEAVPIRNVRSILESLVTWGPREKDVNILTEHVRQGLGSWLAHRASNGKDQVRAVLLDASAEQLFRQHLKPTPAGTFLAMPPEVSSWFEDQLAKALDGAKSTPLIVSMDIRRGVRRLIHSAWPAISVYSYQELDGHVSVEALAMIQGEGAPRV